VWLEGLRRLTDRDVFVVVESEIFKGKFQTATDDNENTKNYFDARYELPDGERASCILDWERRQVSIYATQKNLHIVFLKSGAQSLFGYGCKVDKPEWYLLPDGFLKKEQENDHAKMEPYYAWHQNDILRLMDL